MDQETIRKRLHQAAFPDCDLGARREILAELLAAIPETKSHKDRCALTEAQIIDRLFTLAVTRDPASLCELFPVFAMICGDRKGEKLADVEVGQRCNHVRR